MNKIIKNVTRKELERRGYTIIEVVNIYDDCVEYKVETVGGYIKFIRVFD